VQLYRFEPLERMEDMFRASNVSLAHPSQWPDRYESEFLMHGRRSLHAFAEAADARFYPRRHPLVPGANTAHLTMTNPFGRLVFAQCFTTCEETERMWLAARPDPQRGSKWAVRWSIDSERYLAALHRSAESHESSLVKVRYRPDEIVAGLRREFVERYGRPMSLSGFGSWARAARGALSIKRNRFKDERERRIILIDKTPVQRRDPMTPAPFPIVRERIRLDLAITVLVNEVLLPPDMDSSEVLRTYDRLRAAGFKGLVRRSNLYEAPDFNIVVAG
jgi:hypothetical protein